jgi:hypothetical protein
VAASEDLEAAFNGVPETVASRRQTLEQVFEELDNAGVEQRSLKVASYILFARL